MFDRLRFRLIVRNAADLVPTLQIMLHRCIPFNYIVPGQTVNTLIDLDSLRAITPDGFDAPDDSSPNRSANVTNEFSGQGFRLLNFIADLPVRVDSLVPPVSVHDGQLCVVFVTAEFQVMDQQTADANEQGENSHAQYKHRQHQHVRVRLLREPRRGS